MRILLAAALGLIVLTAAVSCNSDPRNIYFDSPLAEIYLSDGGEGGVTYTPVVTTSPGGADYTLSSSNSTIVRVNEDMTSVTGLRTGQVTLTASTENGLVANMTLRVLARRATDGTDSGDGYVVSFVTKYGSVAQQVVASGETAFDPGNITGAPSGYELYGWYTNPDYTVKYDFSKPVTSNLVLWALWGASDPSFVYSEIDGNLYITGFRYTAVPYTDIVIPAATADGREIYGIRRAAFSENASLETVVIEEGIQVLEEYCFSESTALREVTLPASVVSVGENAFSDCTALESFTAEGNGLISVGASAFQGCTKLNAVTLPDSVETLGEYAFDSAEALTSIALPASLKVLQRGTFRYSGLKSIDLTNVTDIYNEVFWGAVSLETITGTENLTNIGSFAFGRLGTGNARYATAYLGNYSNYEDGLLYLGNALIYAYPVSTRGDYEIKRGTTLIAGQAFDDVPAGIVRFTGAAAETVPSYGTYAFGQKTVAGSGDIVPSMDIVVPAGTTDMYIEKWLVAVKDNENIDVPTVYSFDLAQNIYETANMYDSLYVYARTPFAEFTSGVYFDKNTADEEGSLIAGITKDETKVNYLVSEYTDQNTIEIDLYEILCSGVKSAAIDDILPFAFSGLEALERVTLPNHITNIGSFAFTDCPALVSVRFEPETLPSTFTAPTITSSSFNRSTLASSFAIYVSTATLTNSSTTVYTRYAQAWRNYMNTTAVLKGI